MDYAHVPIMTESATAADSSGQPVRRTRTNLRLRSETVSLSFEDLASTWERDTRNSSDIAANQQHWAYRAIMDQGPTIIPQIIERMRTHGGFWFAALAELADWDPVMPLEWGNVQKMRKAWFRWARQSLDAKAIRNQGRGRVFWEFSETSKDA